MYLSICIIDYLILISRANAHDKSTTPRSARYLIQLISLRGLPTTPPPHQPTITITALSGAPTFTFDFRIGATLASPLFRLLFLLSG
ncbi:hypothetical protein PM082_000625 [Marasmius tenuissimus]|nr:hypothetical protein PM082_000625 [Marasmius tenuissimus]